MVSSMLKEPDYLVVCGGGVRGIAIAGAIRMILEILAMQGNGSDYINLIPKETIDDTQLPPLSGSFIAPSTEESLHSVNRQKYLTNLKGGGGTSIGAFITFAIIAGIDHEQLIELITSGKTWDTEKVFASIKLSEITSSGGLCGHEMLFSFVDELFEILNLPHSLTFSDFFNRTNKYFLCNSSCTDTNSIFLMDIYNTPKMKIRTALVMSMCIPIFFKPFNYLGKLYVDGGLLRNYLIGHFPSKKTLGIRIKDDMSI